MYTLVIVYIFCSVCAQLLPSYPTLATPWTVALQAPQALGFFRHEYCRGLPFSSPGDLPHAGIDPVSPAPPAQQLDS